MAWESSFFDSFCSLRQSGFNYYCVRCELLNSFNILSECIDENHQPPHCDQCISQEHAPSESCQRVTTRDECETLSEQLGLIRTHSYKSTWTHYPPNCFFIDWGHKQALYFNEYQEGNNLPCTADKICVCKNGLLPSGKIHYKWQRFKDQETPLKIFQNLQDHICASKKNPKKTIFSLKQGHQGVWW